MEAKASLKMTSVIPPKKNKSNNAINQSDRDMWTFHQEKSTLESENDNIWESSLTQQDDLFLFKFCLKVITWCMGGGN